MPGKSPVRLSWGLQQVQAGPPELQLWALIQVWAASLEAIDGHNTAGAPRTHPGLFSAGSSLFCASASCAFRWFAPSQLEGR